jgi:hypothetical protein
MSPWPGAFFFKRMKERIRSINNPAEWTQAFASLFPLPPVSAAAGTEEWASQTTQAQEAYEQYKLWIILGEGLCYRRGKTTCSECYGRGHCCSLISKEPKIKKHFAQMGFKDNYRQFK